MKWNNMTGDKIYTQWAKYPKRKEYVCMRACNYMDRKNLNTHTFFWHDPDGYEYYCLVYLYQGSYCIHFFSIAGYNGFERFFHVNEYPDGSYCVYCYTNHFLLRYHNRMVAARKVDRIDAYEALIEYMQLNKGCVSPIVYHDDKNIIYANMDGLVFAIIGKCIVFYKTFVGTEQLKDNQSEAISMVTDIIREYEDAESKYGLDSKEFDAMYVSLQKRVQAMYPQLKELLVNY